MSTSAALTTAGCGCGGSGVSGSGGGCAGCGGTASAVPVATAFVRPRFFAGQLLTEDDLTALADYTLAKDQLHNRYLFGAGVVCGLWVSCDPCGAGTVTVAPGYALDCCGRDLVLSCPAPLDVNAMIRDLRAAQLGQDCGDPCAAQATSAAKRPVTRHYRLYARYGEQSTDPVAPYATGDQCGPVTCEPTRVREGISFVLKCPAQGPSPDGLPARLRACEPGEDILRHLERLREFGEPIAADPAAFGPEEAGDVRSDAEAVREWLLDRLDADPALAGCQLRAQVRAVAVTTKADETGTVRVRSLARAATELVSLFERVMQDCRCRAVNPPCAPCADTDVPLACLEVADCTVVSICNAARDYVVSGTALRYWYPSELVPEIPGCSCDRERDGDRPRPDLAGWRHAVTVPDPDPAEPLPVTTETETETERAERAERAEPPTAADSADGALAQQVRELERRVTELTEQLAGQLTQTRAGGGAAAGEPSARADKPSPRPASPSRRRAAAREPAAAPAPAEAQDTPEARGSAEAPARGGRPGAAATGGSDDDS